MTKQINVRLDYVHLSLLDEMASELSNVYKKKITRTEVIEKALFNFASDYVLEKEKVDSILKEQYKDFKGGF